MKIRSCSYVQKTKLQVIRIDKQGARFIHFVKNIIYRLHNECTFFYKQSDFFTIAPALFNIVCFRLHVTKEIKQTSSKHFLKVRTLKLALQSLVHYLNSVDRKHSTALSLLDLNIKVLYF